MSRPRPDAERLSFGDADKLLGPLARCGHVAIAVSGGPDSVALMLLASRARLPVRFSVLTVDHSLREESAAEAQQVAAWASALGLESHVLRWMDERPASRIQEKAREARYRLMAEWCGRHGAAAIATAHTLDDQAETLIMRLARGSGIDGLSAMSSCSAQFGVPVHRPLLCATGASLRRFVEGEGHPFIDDPSNSNSAFERVRVRRAMPALDAAGLTPRALALAARRLQRARAALDAATDQLELDVVTFAPEGFAIIEAQAYAAAPEDLRVRLLARLLSMTGGTTSEPGLAAVERAVEWLSATGSKARTLGGCRIVRRTGSILVCREGGRMNRSPVPIEVGQSVLWDGRFIVRLLDGPTGPLTLRPLCQTSLAVGVDRPAGLPAVVAETLPAVLKGEDVLFVPQIGLRGPCSEGAILAEVWPSAIPA